MKKYLKKKYIITRIIATILILLTAGVFFYASISPVAQFQLYYKYTDYFSKKWENTPDGDIIDGDYIKVKPGDTVYIYHRLPGAVAPDEAVAIYDPGLYIAVYANGTFLGDFGKDTTDVIGNEVGNSWFMLNIPLVAVIV